MFLDMILAKVYQRHGSDIHIVSGCPIYYRSANGSIEPLSATPISSLDVDVLLRAALPHPRLEHLHKDGETDSSYSSQPKDGSSPIRCRISAFSCQTGESDTNPCYGLTVRLFPGAIPKMEQLRLPLAVRHLVTSDHGLILFSAPTGNGKTTSIASILNAINETQQKRILTIEDPVEYLYSSAQSFVSQREVGRDTKSFASGLRAALREDPDILLIGEIRDEDTIQAALSAAESGHLVFSTVHSSNVIEATDRITQYFPAGKQDAIRAQFANAFTAIIAQKLLPRKDGNGRIAAFEVLLATDATRNLIRTGQAFQLKNYMYSKDGMQTMDADIQRLKQKGLI